MRRLTRLAASGIASLALLSCVTPSALAVGNPDAARKAVDYVVSRSGDANDPAIAADSLLALAAGGGNNDADAARHLLTVTEDRARDYAGRAPQNAAQLLLVATTYGIDPTNFGGVDLIDMLSRNVNPDGTVGAGSDTFTAASTVLALGRAKAPVSPALLSNLLKAQNPDGGFGPQPNTTSDPRITGVVLDALSTQGDSISAKDASARVVSWAVATQRSDGSWLPTDDESPVSATAVLGAALQSAGVEEPKAVSFLVAQQAMDGSLTAPDDGAKLLGTSQAALALSDQSYSSVSNAALAAAATSTPTPTPTSPQTDAAAPSSAAPAPASVGTPSPMPQQQPTGDNHAGAWVAAIVALLLLGGGAVWFVQHRAKRATAVAASEKIAHEDSADPAPAPAPEPMAPEAAPAAPQSPVAGAPSAQAAPRRFVVPAADVPAAEDPVIEDAPTTDHAPQEPTEAADEPTQGDHGTDAARTDHEGVHDDADETAIDEDAAAAEFELTAPTASDMPVDAATHGVHETGEVSEGAHGAADPTNAMGRAEGSDGIVHPSTDADRPGHTPRHGR